MAPLRIIRVRVARLWTMRRMCEVKNTVTPPWRWRRADREWSLGGRGIDAFERLVEKDHARVMQEGQGDRGLLAHSVGAAVEKGVLRAGQAEHAQKLRGTLAGFGKGQSIDRAAEFEMLGDGERIEEAEVLRHHADDAADGQRIFPDVDAGDADLSGVGGEERGEDFQESGIFRLRWGRGGRRRLRGFRARRC